MRGSGGVAGRWGWGGQRGVGGAPPSACCGRGKTEDGASAQASFFLFGRMLKPVQDTIVLLRSSVGLG